MIAEVIRSASMAGARPLLAALAACSAANVAPVVANHARSDDAARPQEACPDRTFSGWEHEIWPACPALPFRYDFDVCNGAACPQPCRVDVERHEPNRPVRTSAEVTYDARGRLTVMTPLAGEYVDETRCTYDGDLMTACGGGLIAYDERRRITLVTDPSESQYGPHAFAYDEHGRVRSATIARRDEDDDRLDYRYDDRGRLIGFDYQSSGIHEHTSYRYGNDGRLAETDNGYVTFRYGYDARGRVVSVMDGRGEVALTYDARGRLVREVTRDDPAEPPRIHTYVYDCR